MNLDTLVDALLPQLPGAPLPQIRDHILAAARTLCTDADIWQARTELYLPAGQREAELDPPSRAAEILRVLAIDGLRAGHDYQQPSPDSVQLRHAQPRPRRLHATVACRPALNIGLRVPLPAALEHWHSALCDQALYRLLRLPGVPWSNPNLAQHHQQLYQAQLNDAQRSAHLGHHQGNRRVRAHSFI